MVLETLEVAEETEPTNLFNVSLINGTISPSILGINNSGPVSPTK